LELKASLVFVFIEISETGGSDFWKMAVGVSKRDGLPYETLTWLCSVSVTCNSLYLPHGIYPPTFMWQKTHLCVGIDRPTRNPGWFSKP
jgi:hypothetical protein